MARELFLSAAAPRLVIDPADSSLTAVPGAVTFRDPARPPDAATARFVPTDPADADAYDRLYGWVFGHFPRYMWCDEAGLVLPVRGAPRWGNTVMVQGRKRAIGHLACHTRPREVLVNVIAQAQHVFCFDLPNPDDRQRVAELAGIPPAVLDEAMAGLAPYGFLWWQQRDRSVTVCPPLPAARARI